MADILTPTERIQETRKRLAADQQVKEATLAQYVNGQKSTVVLTDQTDLGEKMGELGDKLSKAVKEADTTALNAKQLSALMSLAKMLKEHNVLAYRSSKELHKELLQALKNIELSPRITVPEPKVTIQEREIDFTPLQETMHQYFAPPEVEKLDLDCYRAQDIDNSVEGYQYVGFVNPDGHWYIIENDVKGNSLRYVFGKKGYAKAFKKASSYQYRLLNEAVDVL
jgi:hypothetical protein